MRSGAVRRYSYLVLVVYPWSARWSEGIHVHTSLRANVQPKQHVHLDGNFTEITAFKIETLWMTLGRYSTLVGSLKIETALPIVSGSIGDGTWAMWTELAHWCRSITLSSHCSVPFRSLPGTSIPGTRVVFTESWIWELLSSLRQLHAVPLVWLCSNHSGSLLHLVRYQPIKMLVS